MTKAERYEISANIFSAVILVQWSLSSSGLDQTIARGLLAVQALIYLLSKWFDK